MNRQEKLKAAQKIENEIKDIEAFADILSCQDTIRNSKSISFVRRKTDFYLLGISVNDNVVEIKIPEKLRLEIAAKCQIWIKELNRRADEVLTN